MEGKEVASDIQLALFASITTAAPAGRQSLHDSFTPWGLIPFSTYNWASRFGGIGAGLYGMMVFVILAVFLTV